MRFYSLVFSSNVLDIAVGAVQPSISISGSCAPFILEHVRGASSSLKQPDTYLLHGRTSPTTLLSKLDHETVGDLAAHIHNLQSLNYNDRKVKLKEICEVLYARLGKEDDVHKSVEEGKRILESLIRPSETIVSVNTGI
jgi:hypothetical protein